jgi:ATP-dependent Clp protease ATP-binding subunit ClpB
MPLHTEPEQAPSQDQLIQNNTEKDNYDTMKQKMMGVVAQHFRPEFINRIDEVVVIHSFDAQQIIEIAKIKIEGLRLRLKERNLDIELSDAALAKLAEVGFDPVFGARPLSERFKKTGRSFGATNYG